MSFRTSFAFYGCCLLLLLSSPFLMGQSPLTRTVDSLRASLNLDALPNDSLRIRSRIELAGKELDRNPEAAMQLLQEAYDLAETIRSQWGIAQSSYFLAYGYRVKGDDSMAIVHYGKVTPYLESIGDTFNLLDLRYNILNLQYENGWISQVMPSLDSLVEVVQEIGALRREAIYRVLRGLCYQNLGKGYLALEELLFSLTFFSEEADTAKVAEIYQHLASNQLQLGKYEEAEQYNRLSIEAYQSVEDPYFLCQAYINMGELYMNLQTWDSVGMYGKKGLALSRQYDFALDGRNLMHLGRYFQSEKAYDSAQVYFAQAAEVFERENDEDLLAAVKGHWAGMLVEKGEAQAAYELLEGAFKRAEEKKYDEGMFSLYEVMAKACEAVGKTEDALLYWRYYTDYLSYLFDTVSTRHQNELHTRYQTQEKEQALAAAQQKSQQLAAQVEIERLNRRLLWAGILGISMALLAIAYFLQQRNKRNREKHQAEKAAFEQEIRFSERELSTATLHMIQKNELLSQVKATLEQGKQAGEELPPAWKELQALLKVDQQTDQEWQQFKRYFDKVHPNFEARLVARAGKLSQHELRLASLIQLDLSTQEMSAILHISADSVHKARYRLKKKLGLKQDEDLRQFIRNQA
ncbi:MAG: hypothetical protein AAFR61_00975 [Bacteroidota bacterium]